MNILQKQALLTPDPTATFYAVLNGEDYHITLATLIKIVTAASISLERVNNTGDDEKPVSLPQQRALDLKADKTDAVTPAQLQALANELSQYVTQQQLAAAINTINQALTGYRTAAQVQQDIATALTPISVSIGTISGNLATQTGRIDTIMQILGQNGGASAADLQALTTVVNQLASNLSSLQTAFANHTHTVDSITGLGAFIDASITQKFGSVVTDGPHDW